MFGAGITITCTTISTIDDEVYEDDESFIAILSSTNDHILIASRTVVIYITDNDGGFLVYSASGIFSLSYI